MDPRWLPILWGFAAGLAVGWLICDLRWRAAAKKVTKIARELNELVRKLPAKDSGKEPPSDTST